MTQTEALMPNIEVTNGALRLFLLRDPAPTHDVVVPSFDVIE
jgi:hypothetical protein